MSPVWMIEGSAVGAEAAAPETRRAQREQEPAERRLAALAEAVREHEASVRFRAIPARPADISLYRRLRQICAGDQRP